MNEIKNVLGEPLEPCSMKPLTSNLSIIFVLRFFAH
jgi:uncharacterized protein (DUF2237 family)